MIESFPCVLFGKLSYLHASSHRHGIYQSRLLSCSYTSSMSSLHGAPSPLYFTEPTTHASRSTAVMVV